MKWLPVVLTAALATTPALSAPITYILDPQHTYPSFEADHMGGLSIWRGKFTDTSGTVVYDREARTGSIDVIVKMKSIDFGASQLNKHAKSAEMFDVVNYPTARFVGAFSKFNGAAPTEARGMLTMHGVTKPLALMLNSFLCRPDSISKKIVCGADASATLLRSDYGVTLGKAFGFRQEVKLLIQVEGSPIT